MSTRFLVPVLCGLLGGCATLVSEHPVFKAADFDRSEQILGTYSDPQAGPQSVTYYMDRSGEAGLRVIGLMEHQSADLQVFYGDGAVIALGDGDYALQFSCVAYGNGAAWGSADLGPPGTSVRRDTVYALAMKDRRAGSFWVLQNVQDIGGNDSALYKQFGVVRRDIDSGKGTDKDTLAVLPAGMSADNARAFFRALAADVMNGAGGPVLLTQDHSGQGPSSEQKKAMTLTTPSACRAVADHGPRYDSLPAEPDAKQ